jgi:hypothetical protein
VDSCLRPTARIRGACLLPVCLLLLAWQDSAARSTNLHPQSNDQNSEAARAARKKKFDDAKRKIENSDPKPTLPTDDSHQTLFVSPVLVNMLAHDIQSFSLSDIQGHNLTSKADWSIDNSSVADLTTGPVPTITAKQPGTLIVRARCDGVSAEATVTVHAGDKLPIGTIRWQAPKIPGYTTKQIIQAVPR